MPIHLPTYEEPQEFTTSEGVTWRRTGSCNRCGACCRSGDPFGGQRPQGPVAGACPLFAWESEGVGMCTDRQDKYYLLGCVSWPSEPDHQRKYPDCSYVFERVG